MPWRRSQKLFLAAAVSCIVSVFAAFVLVELTILAVLRFGPDSGPVIEALREIYIDGMSLIQYDPACARYDGRLTYRLKAPGCEFGSFEFANWYAVDSLGLRDDEASLGSPEIIVLGDSQAMGWGVEQSESFPERLETLLSRKVLNAGISSYGTARQVMLLERLPVFGLRALVIQYSSNDVRENLEFVDGGGRLPTMSEAEYVSWQGTLVDSRPYVFGSWVTTLVSKRLIEPVGRRLLGKPLRRGLGATPPPGTGGVPPIAVKREAAVFLETLALGPEILRRVPLIVLHLPDDRISSDTFLDAVNRLVAEAPGDYASLRIRTLSLQGRLGPEHFFRVDSHLNASGHRVVAEALGPEVRSLLTEP